MKQLQVFTDGGARGNPGPAGIGVFIKDYQDTVVEKRYKYLGEKTNNEAEYLGAYHGIKRAIELEATDIVLHMDSNLVIQQLLGNWKIKKPELKLIYEQIQTLIQDSKITMSYNWVAREKNAEADRLSNIAMDKQQ